MLTRRLSVGHLVQTLYRQGGLFDRRSLPLAPLEGLRVQQRYQASKGADYEREVRLAGTFPQGALELRLGGRADGVLRRADGWMVEEIKSYGGTLGEAQEDLELHRAQLRCYGALLARQAPDCPETLGFCLTYVQASSGAATAVRWEEPTAALDAFLQRSLMAYGTVLAGEGARLRARNDALSALVFPLPIPRAGQLALARAAFRACQQGEGLLAEAPTGLGKTLGVLFGALKALPSARQERLWIMTPRRTQRRAFLRTLKETLPEALALRVVELPAESTLCLATDGVCSGPACPHGQDFYGRSRPVLQALRAPRRGDRSAIFTTAVLRRLGRRHGLCPVALAQRLARDGDVLLSDVNFAFDPLQRKPALLAPGEGGAMLLLDEAHQLHSRVRGMYRQTLAAGALRSALAEAPAGPWQRPLKALGARLERLPDAQKAGGSGSSGGALSALLDQALHSLRELPFSSPLRPLRGELLRFHRLQQLEEAHPDAFWQVAAPGTLTLALLSPAPVLKTLWPVTPARLLFSATLAPLASEGEALGLPETSTLRLPSPFPRERQLSLLLSDFDLRARHREQALPALVTFLTAWAGQTGGHHLVVVPAFAWLERLAEALRAAARERLGPVQRRSLSEAEQDAFLAELAAPPRQAGSPGAGRLALIVAGGRFSEGMDLPPGALASVLILGLPLPAPDEEQEALAAQATEGRFRSYEARALRSALQSAGRLIRRSADRGVVAFVDRRFAAPALAPLWPGEAPPRRCHRAQALAECEAFWRGDLEGFADEAQRGGEEQHREGPAQREGWDPMGQADPLGRRDHGANGQGRHCRQVESA